MALTAASSNCPREKVNGGWYDGKEVPADVSPIIVELTANVEGKNYQVRIVRAPSINTGFNPFKEAQKEIKSIALEANAALSEKIRADFSKINSN